MTPEEIKRVVSIATSLGIDKVKLTGGEPLIREDIVEIIRKIREIEGIREIAITTNGIRLEELALPLKSAGLDRLNVSLGSLLRDTYMKITGVDAVEKVQRGLLEAKRFGFYPIKLNMVILKGLNDDQIWDMVEFTKLNGFILQLIEVESATSESEYYVRYHQDLLHIEKELTKKAEKIMIRDMQARKRFFLIGGGEVEVVRPMHNTEFCRNCTRLRLTSDGKLKPCLFREDNLIDLLTAMRNGCKDDELRKLFMAAVSARKPYFT
jgi:cyclic pyranopterin phosphate synthase